MLSFDERSGSDGTHQYSGPPSQLRSHRSPVASRATGCTPGKSPMTTYRVRYQTRGDGHVPRAEKTPSDQKFSRW